MKRYKIKLKKAIIYLLCYFKQGLSATFSLDYTE